MQRLVLETEPARRPRRWLAWMWLILWTAGAASVGWIARDPNQIIPEHWPPDIFDRLQPPPEFAVDPPSPKMPFQPPPLSSIEPDRDPFADLIPQRTREPAIPAATPEPFVEMLTQSKWRDSEGEIFAYKFGPLNSAASWIGINAYRLFGRPVEVGEQQLTVGKLYTDSSGTVWRYIGGSARDIKSWAAMPGGSVPSRRY